MSDLVLAKNKLKEGQYTCVLAKNGAVVMTSNEKGIKPLLLTLMEDMELAKDACLADKIIGKAAALLIAYAGIKEVYAYVIGDCAKNVLDEHQIQVEYNRIVPYIMNRDGTDKCPLEKLVEEIQDPKEAFIKISDFSGVKANL